MVERYGHRMHDRAATDGLWSGRPWKPSRLSSLVARGWPLPLAGVKNQRTVWSESRILQTFFCAVFLASGRHRANFQHRRW